jgi:hypothetical protein
LDPSGMDGLLKYFSTSIRGRLLILSSRVEHGAALSGPDGFARCFRN